MGNRPSSMRTAIRHNQPDKLRDLLDKAGDSSGDLINNDYSQDCMLQSCQRSIGNSFYYAVLRHRVEAIKILLQYGADVHSTGYMEETCLHCACRQNHVDSARILIEHGADLKATDDQGHFPIHSAAMSKSIFNGEAMIRYLLQEAGTVEDVTLREFTGRTPLHLAAEVGQLDTVKLLVELGADVNAQSNQGNTPLHTASRHRHVYDYLIEKGADPEIENKACRKPILAEKSSH